MLPVTLRISKMLRQVQLYSVMTENARRLGLRHKSLHAQALGCSLSLSFSRIYLYSLPTRNLRTPEHHAVFLGHDCNRRKRKWPVADKTAQAEFSGFFSSLPPRLTPLWSIRQPITRERTRWSLARKPQRSNTYPCWLLSSSAVSVISVPLSSALALLSLILCLPIAVSSLIAISVCSRRVVSMASGRRCSSARAFCVVSLERIKT
ncbi:hypothetical protein HDK90DRAFT_131408 [Phyllosticta capitalensis]|uniref:Transmembrane protein n=1 Tax=Phyllosticta capitalensis TaxID=121624 RepID=A0ABR1YYD0_9PEZI